MRPSRRVLLAVLVALLAGAAGGYLLIGRGAEPRGDAAPDAVAPAHPRLAEVRPAMEPFGPLTVRVVRTAGGDSLVAGHPEQEADVAALAGALPGAVDAVTAVWGPDWARSAVVAVARTPAEFASLIRATAPVSTETAAASVADPYVPGRTPTGQRVVFSPDAGRRLGPDGLATVLRHELTHVAARAETSDAAPQWLLEGYAEYVAHSGTGAPFATVAPTLAAAVRAGALPDALPADAAFTGADAAQAYERAWSVHAYLAAIAGPEAPTRLYRRLAALPQDTAATDAALREISGTGGAEMIAGWRDWLIGQAAR